VLLGRRSLAEEHVLEALGHAHAALAARPGDPDAMELLAETQTQTADYDGAIDTYEALLAAGLDVADTLAVTCQRGSTAALLTGARRTALERALRARELGLSNEELGFGARLIEEEAERALDRGVEHFAAGRLDGARSSFELAVRCLPDSLEAHNHLAVALHASDRPAEAAEHWQRVVLLAREQELELPEPVHVRLAAALRAEGRADEARAVL
jgi:tetratricopeptide (TPR) repeat protein